MALSATEKWVNGFVVDTSTGNMSVTATTSGASWSFGFLRDADGRLVVVKG